MLDQLVLNTELKGKDLQVEAERYAFVRIGIEMVFKEVEALTIEETYEN